MTFLAYVGTLGLAAVGVTSLPASFVGRLLSHLGGFFRRLARFVGAFGSWAGVDWLWRTFEGGPIPLLALGLTVLVLAVGDEVSPAPRHTTRAEIQAIIIFALVMVLLPEQVRWV